jgi:GNAT superfamily N-acetyltransferase
MPSVAAHPDVTVRRMEPADLPYLEEQMIREFGAIVLVTRGVMHDPRRLPGLVALRDGERVGVACYRILGAECELVAMVGVGVGSQLLTATVHEARRAGCRRLWLITTNDHMRALRFYQREGFDLVALHRNAADDARRLKPEIPRVGLDGIPLHHELELELRL